MRDILKSFKFWLVVSIIILITLTAICISFAGNYRELEELRQKATENSNQIELIESLKSENIKLKDNKRSSETTDQIETILQQFVKEYYNTDGTDSENERALRVRQYVTDELYSKMYDENEKPQTIPDSERITQSCLIEDIIYQSNGNSAKASVTCEIRYTYPDRTKQTQEMLLQVVLQYDKADGLWKISDTSSSIIKLKKVWG